MSSGSDQDDLIRRFESLKQQSYAHGAPASSDAQLAERYAQLTGNAATAFSLSSNSGKASKLNSKTLTENEMIDEILSQVHEESILDTQFQRSSEQALMERLSKLKALPSSTSSKSLVGPIEIVSLCQSLPDDRSTQCDIPSSIDIGWISSDDENNDEVLDKVIQAAMAYETSDEDD
jgi:hypothetical protein